MVVKTPPMGWNSWNTFGPNINEALIRETADTMVDSGLTAGRKRSETGRAVWSLRRRNSRTG